MNRLPDLREALLIAAQRRAEVVRLRPAQSQQSRVHRTIRRAGPIPMLGAGLAAALLTAAVALAASGLVQTGAPVRGSEHFTPTTGYGVPIPSTVRLLPISVPDPAGGPPWGLRYLKTTRGLGCLQVGRVLSGRLGVLGRDGDFGDDGRFHELPPAAFEPLGCTPLDARGHAFLTLTFRGVLASGAILPGGGVAVGCLTAGASKPPATAIHRDGRETLCPRADNRLVSYGLLGPDARSLAYRVGAVRRMVQVERPLGAYLVVQPISQHTTAGGIQSSALAPMPSPGTSPFVEVRYTHGRICHIPPANRAGGDRPCPLVGFVAPRSVRLSPAQLASPVSVNVGWARSRANPVYAHRPHLARRLRLTFKAPIAVPNANSGYLVELLAPQGRGCESHMIRETHSSTAEDDVDADGSEVMAIERDVAAGERVHVGLLLDPACRGRWSGSVVYEPPLVRAGPAPLSRLEANLTALAERGRRRPIVGRFSFELR